jgi:ribosomal protein S18 acetylase RimI-like enzyme
MIIDAQERDWPRIEDVAAKAAVLSDEEAHALEAVWEEYLDLGPEDSGYTFLIDQEGEAIRGFVCYGPRDLTDGVCDLYYLVVDTDARRQSVGRRLLKAAEAEACDAGARMMLAEISSGARHQPMAALLMSAGYQAEAAIRDFYAVGEDLAIMVKRF